MKKSIFIFIIVLKITFIKAQLSGIYQIGVVQPFPFNSLKNAAEHISTVGVSGAVTFILADTLYEEDSIEFKTIAGTSITNTITLQPDDETDVEIRGSGDFVIGIDRTSHLSFNGLSQNGTGSLTIRSSETTVSSSVIKCTTPTNTNGNMLNIHITNCTIMAAPPFFSENFSTISYGINFQNFSVHTDSVILNNNKFNGGDYAIYIHYSSILVYNNDFTASGGISNSYSYLDNITVIRNNYFDNTNLGYSYGALSLVYFRGDELVFTNNVFNGVNYNFTSFNDDCILFYFTGVKNAFISNNIFKNINYNATFTPVQGIDLGSIISIFAFNGNEHLKFYHNSVYIPEGNENGFVSGEALFTGIALYNNQNIEIKNNIFAFLQGNKPDETVNSTASVYGLSDKTNLTGLQSNNNIYYVANHTNNYFYSISGGTNGNLSQWQTNYPDLDQNSYWEMPNVVSPDDLHLTQDCNRGTPIAEVPLDFEGTIRSTTSPDIGAYELISELNFVTGGNCQLTLIQFDIINGQNIQSALWNFGDSQTSTELEPTHTYANAGTYSVTLTVTFNDNTTKTISKEITIYEKPYKSNILHD